MLRCRRCAKPARWSTRRVWVFGLDSEALRLIGIPVQLHGPDLQLVHHLGLGRRATGWRSTSLAADLLIARNRMDSRLAANLLCTAHNRPKSRSRVRRSSGHTHTLAMGRSRDLAT